jgi:ABC-type sugar transport system substrate-binding protein
VITKYSDLSLLVGIWSYNAPAIVDVVKEKNAREKFTIVTFDAEAIAIQQMGEGMIDAMRWPNSKAIKTRSRACFPTWANPAAISSIRA